jgi:hypothetical protein
MSRLIRFEVSPLLIANRLSGDRSADRQAYLDHINSYSVVCLNPVGFAVMNVLSQLGLPFGICSKSQAFFPFQHNDRM